ncbi:MlaA family lipoprotein [Desulfobulbus alkaliphilus]|uniref:MlaA family lipoprotein n=1 Tax=Desulfobulbus alkaliphilus TaxID=869814 RepID=UPI001963C552|nr:VacJ family lipoprotein [Desulfobulbus alkaliphilus]MBM9535760.1 VacJ family lipoprotein [Desulfobulbus alkaliphilus]
MKLKWTQFFSLRLVLPLMLAALLVGAGTCQAFDFLDDASYEEFALPNDPLEPLNRVIFTFNDIVYIWVLNPVATGYSKVVPADIRGCVANFFHNLGEPVRSANCLLQGRFRDSGRALGRFFINTVFGVFGLADPASNEFRLAPVRASFGETLSVWGVGDGFYLVVPFMGPSTLRDFSGSMVDIVAVTTYYPWNDDLKTATSVYTVNTVNRTSLHLGEYERLKAMSFDPYVAFRNGYFQMRERRVDFFELDE